MAVLLSYLFSICFHFSNQMLLTRILTLHNNNNKTYRCIISCVCSQTNTRKSFKNPCLPAIENKSIERTQEFMNVIKQYIHIYMCAHTLETMHGIHRLPLINSLNPYPYILVLSFTCVSNSHTCTVNSCFRRQKCSK